MKLSTQRFFMLRPWQRHGLVLMVGGLTYIANGVSFFAMSEIAEHRAESLVLALRIMPLNVWAFIFVLVGLMAVISSRWPVFSESWGYILMTSLSAAWSAMYFLGMLVGARATNISYGLIWGLMGFMWWGISGLLNPEKVLAVVVPNGTD